MTMIPERDITKQLDQVIQTMLIELLAVVLIAFLISTLVSNIFTKPIVQLTKTMQQVRSEDNLVEIPQKHPRNDEISFLYHNYNRMIRRITQLVEEIKYNMDLQKKAELKALQSQINPHFIYNTLDVVNWMALCEGQKDISVLVTSLADIFRYSIKEPDAMVTLEKELFHLSQYLKIQAMRYGEKFTFDVGIPEDCLSYQLPKLTIQPLVENSLLHVINKNSQVVHVHLSVEKTELAIRIVLSDTGRLADPEKLNLYLQGEDVLQYSGEGIGIRNLNKRLKMHFGDNCGLHYERTDAGLAAVLILPRMQD
jgi:two-component system sensor histidine kinase YesM